VWERQRHESAKAYQAFLIFRDCGEQRTLRLASERAGKSRPMLARWSARFHWADRAFAWDVSQRQEAEAVVRTARREALERQARDAEQLQRLGMARLARLVSRDPTTGEPQLDTSVTPKDAVAVYRLGLEIARQLPAGPEAAPEETADQEEIRRMTDQELRRLIALAKERAGTEGEEENGDEN
jgi:hypothetical protein